MMLFKSVAYIIYIILFTIHAISTSKGPIRIRARFLGNKAAKHSSDILSTMSDVTQIASNIGENLFELSTIDDILLENEVAGYTGLTTTFTKISELFTLQYYHNKQYSMQMAEMEKSINQTYVTVVIVAFLFGLMFLLLIVYEIINAYFFRRFQTRIAM